MPKEKITENQISETFNKMCSNADKCGFEAYIIRRNAPKLKSIPLSEKTNSKNETFRKILKDMFFEIIKEVFLSEDAEFVDGSQMSDNQHKFYIFQQSEKFCPFQFLNSIDKDIEPFTEDDLQEASGLAFRVRIGEEQIWLYQHLWSIMIPNKKKTNIMARLQHFEKQLVLSEQQESLIAIAKKIDIVILNDCLITGNTDLLQKNFGFQDYIYQTASVTVSKIELKNIIANTKKLEEYISRGKPKYAKKMMRISESKVFLLTAEQLIEKVETLSRWKGKFDIDKEQQRINLNTYAQVESIIDLFDERYTRSEVTNTEYDTDVKSVAPPL